MDVEQLAKTKKIKLLESLAEAGLVRRLATRKTGRYVLRTQSPGRMPSRGCGLQIRDQLV